jgi:hypothetical protein
MSFIEIRSRNITSIRFFFFFILIFFQFRCHVRFIWLLFLLIDLVCFVLLKLTPSFRVNSSFHCLLSSFQFIDNCFRKQKHLNIREREKLIKNKYTMNLCMISLLTYTSKRDWSFAQQTWTFSYRSDDDNESLLDSVDIRTIEHLSVSIENSSANSIRTKMDVDLFSSD